MFFWNVCCFFVGIFRCILKVLLYIKKIEFAFNFLAAQLAAKKGSYWNLLCFIAPGSDATGHFLGIPQPFWIQKRQPSTTTFQPVDVVSITPCFPIVSTTFPCLKLWFLVLNLTQVFGRNFSSRHRLPKLKPLLPCGETLAGVKLWKVQAVIFKPQKKETSEVELQTESHW